MLASSEDLLLHLVGLTSHGGLVDGQLGGVHDDTVDWDGHAVLDLEYVTDVEEVVVEDLKLPTAENLADVLGVRSLAGLDELNLFLPVDEGTNRRDKNDSDHNSSAFNPSVGTMLWRGENHVKGDCENGGHHQHFEHEIVEGADEERNPQLRLNGFSIIVSKLIGPSGEVLASQTDLGVDL